MRTCFPAELVAPKKHTHIFLRPVQLHIVSGMSVSGGTTPLRESSCMNKTSSAFRVEQHRLRLFTASAAAQRCCLSHWTPGPYFRGACGMVVDTQSSAKSSNQTAGEVLQPHQLLEQGDERRQCSRLRHMIIRSTVMVHVPKLRPKQRTEVPEQRELSPRPRTRNSWRGWTSTEGSDRQRGSSFQSRCATSRAISDISSDTEGSVDPLWPGGPFPPYDKTRMEK